MSKETKRIFNRQIALPQDHGSWVFLLSPLLIGLFAGGRFTLPSLYLVVGALSAFLLRQPVGMGVKAFSGRRPREILPAARFWILVYGLILLLSLIGLVAAGFGFVLLLSIPGLIIFTWHLWLVSRRAERRQAGVEILATGVLALGAPAAYWIGQESYHPLGWTLWMLVWLQSAASIVYAYLRLEQRKQVEVQERSVQWRMGKRALQYTTFNLVVTFALGWFGWLPIWIFVPYSLQWLETVWGITHPATGWKPSAIGTRQLIVSTLFTLLFIVFWRL